MKRILTLIFCFLFLVSALTGCTRVSAGGETPEEPIAEPAAAAEPATEEPAAEAPAVEAPALSDAVFTLNYSATYTAPVQSTAYTAGDGYIFGIVRIDAPADYGLTTKDDAELRLSDGTTLSTTISSMSTDADGVIGYFELVFAVPKEKQELVESLLIDGQLFALDVQGAA